MSGAIINQEEQPGDTVSTSSSDELTKRPSHQEDLDERRSIDSHQQ